MKKQIALFGTTLLFSTLLGSVGVSAQVSGSTTDPNPSTAQTQVTGQLQLSENGGFNPNPPSDLNEKTGIENSYFGIAYKPTNFNIGTVPLADTNEEQFIVMDGQTGEKTFHIAVKDKYRENQRNWTLQANLSSAIDQENLGISIKSGTTADSVKRNINNGTDVFNNEELIDQVKKDGTNKEVTNTDNLVITTTPTNVMQSVNDKFVNGVYDLELPEVQLHIPNASKVQAQTLNQNVVWNLTSAPQ